MADPTKYGEAVPRPLSLAFITEIQSTAIGSDGYCLRMEAWFPATANPHMPSNPASRAVELCIV